MWDNIGCGLCKIISNIDVILALFISEVILMLMMWMVTWFDVVDVDPLGKIGVIPLKMSCWTLILRVDTTWVTSLIVMAKI